jgi:hypothetical protein
VNLREPQVPALVDVRRLRQPPHLVYAPPNPPFHIDPRHSAPIANQRIQIKETHRELSNLRILTPARNASGQPTWLLYCMEPNG